MPYMDPVGSDLQHPNTMLRMKLRINLSDSTMYPPGNDHI